MKLTRPICQTSITFVYNYEEQIPTSYEPIDGAGSTSNYRCLWINEVMTYAVNTGLIQHNPLVGIRVGFKKTKWQNMPTIRPDELPAFIETLSKAGITTTTKSLIEWQPSATNQEL